MTNKHFKTIELIKKKLNDKYYNCRIRIEGFNSNNELLSNYICSTKNDLIKYIEKDEKINTVKYFKINIIRDSFFINYSSSDED
tara:strand:- start:231 stop:482 length:252 start_codon:yes stop_codon:yes gene_type:complete